MFESLFKRKCMLGLMTVGHTLNQNKELNAKADIQDDRNVTLIYVHRSGS